MTDWRSTFRDLNSPNCPCGGRKTCTRLLCPSCRGMFSKELLYELDGPIGTGASYDRALHALGLESKPWSAGRAHVESKRRERAQEAKARCIGTGAIRDNEAEDFPETFEVGE